VGGAKPERGLKSGGAVIVMAVPSPIVRDTIKKLKARRALLLKQVKGGRSRSSRRSSAT